jgi:hypothetical protein
MPEQNYVPDPIPRPRVTYPTLDLGGGGAAGSVAQQVFNDEPTPTDVTKPALSFPTGGGSLSQWTGAAWV